VLARDNRLLRLDARTGARRGSIAVSWPDTAGLDSDKGVPIDFSPLTGHIARVDVATGKELWAQELHGNINYWTVAGPDLWVHVSDGKTKDHVVRLDLRTGKPLQTVQLPDLGVTTMTAVDGKLWVGTLNGQIDVVTPSSR
jgi:outer membrane protein assembly factor BamB